MDLMEQVFARARSNPQRIAFSEGDDSKIMQAAYETAKNGFGFPVLAGNAEELKAHCRQLGFDGSKLEFVDIRNEPFRDHLIEKYLALPNNIWGEKSLIRRMSDPLNFALVMEAVGEVDVTFGGINISTGDFILAAQSIIGIQDGVDTISGVGFAKVPGWEGSEGNLIATADNGVATNPNASELASIAIASCETVNSLTGWEPRCAMLSYSTLGSGFGELVDKVREAVDIARQRRPDLKIDGEFQLDSAINPLVAAKKVKRPSEVAGRANIIIFPDLNAGNIGIKLMQNFAKAEAYGPMLQGFKKICSDCSRGASVSELVGNIAFSIVRAANTKSKK
jgi:phosphate acetyltransferase